MRAVKRTPHPRDKNRFFQAFLSLPGWEGKVTPEPSHPAPGESQGEIVGNERICAMGWLGSITPHRQGGAGAAPQEHRDQGCPHSKANIQ